MGNYISQEDDDSKEETESKYVGLRSLVLLFSFYSYRSNSANELIQSVISPLESNDIEVETRPTYVLFCDLKQMALTFFY